MDELSNYSLVKLSCIRVFFKTKYPAPFYVTSVGVGSCNGDETYLILCWTGRIMAIFFAIPSSSLIIRYSDPRIGRKFPWLGFLFPQTKHFLSYDSVFMCSWKRLWDKDKD